MPNHFLLALTTLGLTVATCASGQPVTTNYNLADLNRRDKLEVVNRELQSITEQGREGVRFSEKAGEGVAWLTGVNFSNGVIELDIKGKDLLQRSFVGIAFHGQDDKTFDAIYFRPFNFLATDSVRRIHAVQYVSHPDFPWKRLRDQQNGVYEKAVRPAPDPNDWFHARLVVDYPHIRVYVNHSSEPCLSVDQISRREQGSIGLWVGEGAGGDFANLTITSK